MGGANDDELTCDGFVPGADGGLCGGVGAFRCSTSRCQLVCAVGVGRGGDSGVVDWVEGWTFVS